MLKLLNSDEQLQNLHDEFVKMQSTFYLLAIAPNFVINGKSYVLPMVTEESSVVAASANAANFDYPWKFHAEIVGTEKRSIPFYFGTSQSLKGTPMRGRYLRKQSHYQKHATTRVVSLILNCSTAKNVANYYRCIRFETADAMGANFINSCLEQLAQTLQNEAAIYEHFSETEKQIEVVMSILSNYVPGSRVKSWVSCPIEELGDDGDVLAKKFVQAVEIAHHNNYRAVTHNKGIMNGVDALAIATGNDFRKWRLTHAYAAR